MTQRVYRVLFLCRSNCARSLMAEALVNALGHGHFEAYSAGSQPATQADPRALQELSQAHLNPAGLTPKSWTVFLDPKAPPMDFVITLCDEVCNDVAPLWPGQPVTAHWHFADPAQGTGSAAQQQERFHQVFRELMMRVQLFLNLPEPMLEQTAHPPQPSSGP